MKKEDIKLYWIVITFGLFFIQNLIVFITIFVWSYPNGYVTIATNNYGELIFEICLSGLLVIGSCIGLFKIKKWVGRLY